MATNALFFKLCKPETMRAGWYLASGNARHNFVTDPIAYNDFTSHLDDRLNDIIERVMSHRYRPRHLLEVDIPKSGLSVRPGTVLPIEESVLLHAIIYVLAPKLDRHLAENVYSYRLHKKWSQQTTSKKSIFREGDEEIPFLKSKTIRKLDPFEPWYSAWPDFDAHVGRAYRQMGYRYSTKTDITAYFENIDLELLESQLTGMLRNEIALIQLVIRVFHSWTRVTSVGSPLGRGIPQGNTVSSFFANLYLLPLDSALAEFCSKRQATWYRYMDDVKVFSHDPETARDVVFVINDALRQLHLNLQGSKTEIVSGADLERELDDSDDVVIDAVWNSVQKVNISNPKKKTYVTGVLNKLRPIASRFRRRPTFVLRNLDARGSRNLRRVMTVYGRCGRTYMLATALHALECEPDQKVLDKVLRYFTQMPYKEHAGLVDHLLTALENDVFPFPYQCACVLNVMRDMHPRDPSGVAGRVHTYALKRKRSWIVRQKAGEAISSLPYRSDHATSVSCGLIEDSHPWVRRAGGVLLARAPIQHVRTVVHRTIHHPDAWFARLSLYWLRHLEDKQFAIQLLDRLKTSMPQDRRLVRALPSLYMIRANSDRAVVQK